MRRAGLAAKVPAPARMVSVAADNFLEASRFIWLIDCTREQKT
jgi:hypothetical protein